MFQGLRIFAVALLLCAVFQDVTAGQTSLCQIEKSFSPNASELENFGQTVAVSADKAVIGAKGWNHTQGTAYVYKREGASWMNGSQLIPDDPALGGDAFGNAVAMDAKVTVVGAWLANYNCTGGDCDQGAAYVFEETADQWQQTAKLQPSDLLSFDFFGHSVVVKGDTIFVAAPGQDPGAVYVFEKLTDTWTQTAKLSVSDGTAGGTIGYSLAFSGNRAVFGAPGKNIHGDRSGAAYVFEKTGSEWLRVATLAPEDGADNDQFGQAVAIDGDTILVGSFHDDDVGRDTGSAYFFERRSDQWVLTAKVLPPDARSYDWFGASTALTGDLALVGAVGNSTAGEYSGAVYAYTRVSGTWILASEIWASDPTPGAGFGLALGLSRSNALIGVGRDDTFGLGSGATYFFLRGEVLAGNVNTGDGTHPMDVVALNGLVGDSCRNLTVTAGTPASLYVNAALSGNGQYALWILDGGIAAGDKVWFRDGSGRRFDLGTGVRCLPVNNTLRPDACPCPMTFP